MTQTHIILVRHGEAASAWSEHPDPGLSVNGVVQAKEVSKTFGEKFLGYGLLSSPKIRAIETMRPIELNQQKQFVVLDILSEIPSQEIEAEDKKEWLTSIFTMPIDQLPDPVKAWRQNLILWVEGCKKNVIVTTHFMVINALISYLSKQNTMTSFHPGYASRTEIWLENGVVIKLELGDSKKTTINL